MTVVDSLAFLFLFAFVFSLILTPGVREMGIRLGAMDLPSERKVHTNPIPRVGGIALFIVIVAARFLPLLFPSMSDIFKFKPFNWFAFGGMCVVFGCGVWDDFRRLNPWVKLLFQILAASLAFSGGIAIQGIFVANYGVTFCFICSYFITVFWFLLFINAINLIDGLDGLAGGIVFFTCVLMVLLTYFNGDYASAFYFCVLGGAMLGFLRYNFNPASIFLGDGGSYFLGYFIALLAIQGSMKSQVGVLMLIPMLALGVPIFDTVFSPIRRWILGRGMFHPDKGHFHHHLLRMGFSSRNAVLFIYGITLVLCLMGTILIALRGQGFEGLFLGLLLFILIFLMGRLGYLEYLAVDKFYGWFKDVTDVAGFSQNRRGFLSIQIAIGKSQKMDELWENLIEALEMLKVNQAQLYLPNKPVREWKSKVANIYSESSNAPSGTKATEITDGLLKVELPLRDAGDEYFLGKLVLVKDLKLDRLQPFTIRRFEHLRRTLIPVLKRLKSGE